MQVFVIEQKIDNLEGAAAFPSNKFDENFISSNSSKSPGF